MIRMGREGQLVCKERRGPSAHPPFSTPWARNDPASRRFAPVLMRAKLEKWRDPHYAPLLCTKEA
jgi:hypothetical protein